MNYRTFSIPVEGDTLVKKGIVSEDKAIERITAILSQVKNLN